MNSQFSPQTGAPPSPPPAKGVQGRWLHVAILALLMTLLNAVKPLHIDDTAYYYFATWIAEHPLDPYGGKVFWYQEPQPAQEILAPPVLLYWWALAIRLFGENPVLWKLWLLPFSLLFVCALSLLFRRFCRDLEVPLLWMTAAGPTFLPSLNLMLDVPALALALMSLAVFFRACDKGSWLTAILAGALAGLAMQTKYSSFPAVPAMLIYALIQGFLHRSLPLASRLKKCGLGLLSVGVAAAIFISWESYVAARHGESHFLHHFGESGKNIGEKLLTLSLPMLALLGGVACVGILLNLVALCRNWFVVTGMGAVLLAGYVLIWLLEKEFTVELSPPWSEYLGMRQLDISLEQVIFTVLGFLLCLTEVIVLSRLLRVCKGGLWRPTRWRRDRISWFLVLWLLLEIGGYFALTPFVAVRRVMGVVVVGTLLAGRLACLTCREPRHRVLLWVPVMGNILLGLLFYSVDLREAQATKDKAGRVVEIVRQQDPEARIWFVGHWGFQYYAERAGMKPIIPGKSEIGRNDWLVIPHRVEQQDIRINPDEAKMVLFLELQPDFFPLRTVPAFYGTSTGVPLEHHAAPRFRVDLYRANKDFVAH